MKKIIRENHNNWMSSKREISQEEIIDKINELIDEMEEIKKEIAGLNK